MDHLEGLKGNYLLLNFNCDSLVKIENIKNEDKESKDYIIFLIVFSVLFVVLILMILLCIRKYVICFYCNNSPESNFYSQKQFPQNETTLIFIKEEKKPNLKKKMKIYQFSSVRNVNNNSKKSL